MSIEINEVEILNQFRQTVADLGKSDNFLLRFLRARNHNLEAAEEMVRKAVEWHTVNQLDNASNWKIEDEFPQQCPMEYPGFDYNGNSILYLNLGKWPERPIIEAGKLDEFKRYLYKHVEGCTRMVDEFGRKIVLLVDLKGLSFYTCSHYPTVQANLNFCRNIENCFPEILQRLIFINAPAIAHWVWPVIKTVLTGTTLSKVEFFGNNEAVYMPALLSRIPATSLPHQLSEQAEKYKLEKEF